MNELNEANDENSDKLDELIEDLSKIDNLDDLNVIMETMAMAGGPMFDALVERMSNLGTKLMQDSAVNMALLAWAMEEKQGVQR